ncbi:unnamed protein product [Microthlaspi erraticum]|uniref:Uncharacterized protein n=1 Tax=Microthlaspi erraticum TaxID=1685480 RepID=A0A6D2LBH6_9BRAS|nr:unnamed protein product [Microthlaspi erraticum]
MNYSNNNESSISYPATCRSYLGYRRVGIPKKCRCGCDVALRSSHDGKKLYICTGWRAKPHNVVGRNSCRELAELKDDLADLDTQLIYIIQEGQRIDQPASEIEWLKESARKREAKYALHFKLAVACGLLASLMALTAPSSSLDVTQLAQTFSLCELSIIHWHANGLFQSTLNNVDLCTR